VNVELRLDQLAPHDPRHLVAVELDDRLSHLDFRHGFSSSLTAARPAAGRANSSGAKIRAALQRGKRTDGHDDGLPSDIIATAIGCEENRPPLFQ
jgi:hypothetical protein